MVSDAMPGVGLFNPNWNNCASDDVKNIIMLKNLEKLKNEDVLEEPWFKAEVKIE